MARYNNKGILYNPGDNTGGYNDPFKQKLPSTNLQSNTVGSTNLLTGKKQSPLTYGNYNRSNKGDLIMGHVNTYNSTPTLGDITGSGDVDGVNSGTKNTLSPKDYSKFNTGKNLTGQGLTLASEVAKYDDLDDETYSKKEQLGDIGSAAAQTAGALVSSAAPAAVGTAAAGTAGAAAAGTAAAGTAAAGAAGTAAGGTGLLGGLLGGAGGTAFTALGAAVPWVGVGIAAFVAGKAIKGMIDKKKEAKKIRKSNDIKRNYADVGERKAELNTQDQYLLNAPRTTYAGRNYSTPQDYPIRREGGSFARILIPKSPDDSGLKK